jgi:hypothetical protein
MPEDASLNGDAPQLRPAARGLRDRRCRPSGRARDGRPPRAERALTCSGLLGPDLVQPFDRLGTAHQPHL